MDRQLKETALNAGRRKGESEANCRYCGASVHYDRFGHIRNDNKLMHQCPNPPSASQQAKQVAEQARSGLVV